MLRDDKPTRGMSALRVAATAVAFCVVSFGSIAASYVDKFRISAEERAACSGDAERLCSASYPDEDKLLQCMKASKNNLTPICRAAFQKGLKRRGIPWQ